jgi:3-hydroxybutyryl-CoA dehydrogenase
MAIFHLSDAEPVVYLLPDKRDQRSAATLADLLQKHKIQFFIIANEYEEPLSPFAHLYSSNLASVTAQPTIVIDCTINPITEVNEFLPDILDEHPSVCVLSSSPVTTTSGLSVMYGIMNIARVNFLHGFFSETLVEVSYMLEAEHETKRTVDKFLRSLEIEPLEIEDIVGFVKPRILSMIINEAAFAVMENISSAQEIDEAMRLGVNYPKGPLAWADEIGISTVLIILEALYAEYKEPRYRPCRLLRLYPIAGWDGVADGQGFFAH